MTISPSPPLGPTRERARRRLPRAWGAFVAALLALPGGAAAQSGDSLRTTADGVYTDEQAERGERIVLEVCAACHQSDYFTGTFQASWRGARVSALYDLIRTRMPEDNPGGLSRREYAEVLAYIFKLNGLPPGDEALGSTTSTLERIVIEWSP